MEGSAAPVSRLAQETSYPGTCRRISSNAASGVRSRIGLADAVPRQLVGQDAQNVEVRARPHEIAALANELNFAGRVGHGAVFFVGRKSRQHDVGEARCLRQEYFVHDQKVEVAQPIRAAEVRASSRDSRRRRKAP